VSAGAPAAVLAHVPTCPGRLHRMRGPVQAVSQHTSSTQLPEAQSTGSTQPPPLGMRVLVGVAVGVWVGVLVGVFVGVVFGVSVGVPFRHVPLQVSNVGFTAHVS
jgi:hypothetical protein